MASNTLARALPIEARGARSHPEFIKYVSVGVIMIDKRLSKLAAGLMAWSMLFSTLAFGQTVSPAGSTAASRVTTGSDFLIEVAGTGNVSGAYSRESEAVARVLTSKAGKNAVLIDNQGYAREIVLQSVASRLAASNGKRLFRVNWNAVFSSGKDEAGFDRTLKGLLDYAAASKGKTAIYLDDIAS